MSHIQLQVGNCREHPSTESEALHLPTLCLSTDGSQTWLNLRITWEALKIVPVPDPTPN